MLSLVPIRDKVCGAGAKSLKTLECGREHLIYVVTTTSLPHSLITLAWGHWESLNACGVRVRLNYGAVDAEAGTRHSETLRTDIRPKNPTPLGVGDVNRT